MTSSGREVQLERYPRGRITAKDFRLVTIPVLAPGPGEVLVRNTWTSVDPGLRLRLRETGPPGYFAALPLRAAMDGILTVGTVVESRAAGFSAGDVVSHGCGWRDYAVINANEPVLNGLGALTRLDTRLGTPEKFLGPLGGQGLTAWAGLFEAGRLRDGDIVWVSAAAGAVGSLAAQFAKLRGHRVIGSAGSDQKVAYLLDELGLDAAFNYRTAPVAELLRQAAPEGIDVYFDNVGGDHLEAALWSLRRAGRIALCGEISQYERTEPAPGPSNLFQITANELSITGVRGSRHVDRLPEVQRQVAAWLKDGRLRYRESITEGLERAPEALVDLLSGANVGKTLVRIA